MQAATSPNFGIVILAAGASTRMGEPKQLLHYRDKPLLRHAAEVALEACEQVIVVLGSRAAELRPALAELPVTIAENPDWAGGMGTSIRTGVAAAVDLDGIILTLADQPLITSEFFHSLVQAHLDSAKPIVTSQYAGTVGVPVFFAREYFPHLLALDPSQGCKGVILKHSEHTLRLDCPEAEMDVDTPEDYSRVQAALTP